jgi:huntingtin-interacting protein 1-related protein
VGLTGHNNLTSRRVDHPIPKGKFVTKSTGGIGDLVEQEMLGAAKAIEAATQHLQQLLERPHEGRSSESLVGLQVHDSILQFLSAALEITKRNCALDQGCHRAGQGRKFDTAILQT